MLVPALLVVMPANAAPPPAPGYACTTQAGPPAADPIKIMIAGDSITNASAGDYTWPYWLWRDQISRGANIDFVGRFQDTINSDTLQSGSRQYLDCDFDQDHEARPGVKLKSVVSGKYAFGSKTSGFGSLVPAYGSNRTWINGATATYAPDLMVLFAGANDLANTSGEGLGSTEAEIAASVINNLKFVIGEARAGNPGLDIVLTTVPAAANSRITLYNQALPGVVEELSTPDQQLVLANLPSWSGNTWDGLHPNAMGEVAIAAEVADALNELNPAVFPRPVDEPSPQLGPRVAPTLNTELAAGNAVKLTWTLPPGGDRTQIFVRDVTAGATWSATPAVDIVKASLRDFFPGIGTMTCGRLLTTDQAASDTRRLPCITHTLGGLVPGHQYEFKVRSGKGTALAIDLESNVEAELLPGSTAVGKVATPTTVTGVHSVRLSWPAVSGATIYDVWWRVRGSSAYSKTTAPAVTSPNRTISGLVAGRSYGFLVRARNDQSTGAWSTERVAVPKAAALAPGKKPVLSKVSGLRIKAVWAASAGANRYQVWRRPSGGAWKLVATSTARTLVSGKLKKGRTYEFRVRPYDGDVAGQYSPVARRKAV